MQILPSRSVSLIALLPVSNAEALTDAIYVGYCKHGDKCWFLHADGSEERSPPSPDAAECIICYDKPVTYGLMGASEMVICEGFVSDDELSDGCSHVLCVQVRINSVDTLYALTTPISDLCLRHAVHSTVASPKQQDR